VFDLSAEPITPEDSAVAREALVDWFECEECIEGQLSKVVKLATLLEPSLSMTLQGGLGAATHQLLQSTLEARYDELVKYGKSHPNAKISMSRKEFVELHIANYEAQYRVRAAIALACISSDASKQALTKAKSSGNRPDVHAAIIDAIKDANAGCCKQLGNCPSEN